MSEEQATVAPSGEMVAFKAEVRQLLDILAHSLYTEREVFLRELISNASDALQRLQFEMLTTSDVREPEAELAIWISADREARTITIRDSGIGMTREEMIEHLGTIAQSGARNFIQRASEGGKSATTSAIIGQFGVGFYSVFMVADRVTVTSLSYRPDAEAAQWEATGGDTYTIAPADKAERGTTIVLHLKEDATEFANTWRLEQIIRKHSNFVAYPIYMDDRRINEEQALWRQAPRNVEVEKYADFYRQLTMDTEPPLLHMHLSTDVPVDLHAILFVPAQRERGLIERRVEGTIKLYSRKVLIQEDAHKELLPNFLRFVEGVVDSEDIPLNVSREAVQNSPVIQRIRKSLTGRLMRELGELANNDTEKFATFWKQFGVFFKEGLALEFEQRDEIIKLLRFYSTHHADETLVSLAEYTSRMIDGQKEIYYLLASDLEAARHSPHLDPLRARGLEVLLMTDMVDGFMLSGLREYEGHILRNIDDASLELPGAASEQEYGSLSEEEFGALTKRFADALGERVKAVRASKVLRDNPARLVWEDAVPGREMQRIQQVLGQDVPLPPRILELNRAHPLIVNLAQRVAANPDDELTGAIAEQLYDNALLLEGLHTNPASMVSRIQTLIEAAAKG